MNNPFTVSELKHTDDFPLAKLAQGNEMLPDRELKKPIESFLSKIEDLTEGLIANKEEGCRREAEVAKELQEKYPESEGYTIISEVYLRDNNGNIVRDPETGTARRIDFVVIKDGKVVDSIEVTSNTADKTSQTAKEARIRENGGNYIKAPDGSLIQMPQDLTTHIVRKQ